MFLFRNKWFIKSKYQTKEIQSANLTIAIFSILHIISFFDLFYFMNITDFKSTIFTRFHTRFFRQVWHRLWTWNLENKAFFKRKQLSEKKRKKNTLVGVSVINKNFISWGILFSFLYFNYSYHETFFTFLIICILCHAN